MTTIDGRPIIQNGLVEAEGELRSKNQVTVPKRIAEVLGVHPGDRLIFVVDENDPDVVHVRKIRQSYAGALAGVYGTPEEARAYVRREQEAWEE